MVMTKLQVDRRLIACVLTFGLITPYMFLPIGFGNIYLHKILLGRVAEAGLDITNVSVIKAMTIPALGMLCGLLIAFISYGKKRQYDPVEIPTNIQPPKEKKKKIIRSDNGEDFIKFLIQF